MSSDTPQTGWDRQCQEQIVVCVKMSTLLSLGDLYNNKHVVKVREQSWSWFKKKKNKTTFILKWEANSGVPCLSLMFCWYNHTKYKCYLLLFHWVSAELTNSHWWGWNIITANRQNTEHNSEEGWIVFVCHVFTEEAFGLNQRLLPFIQIVK